MDYGDSRRNLIPRFAHGLTILVVDSDTTSLMSISSTLEQYSYNATTTESAYVALSMVRHQKDRFRLVIANMEMSDMSSLSFLGAMNRKNIPVIMMSKNANFARQAIAEGACYFLKKPIPSSSLKSIWQHAFTSDLQNPIINVEQVNLQNDGKGNEMIDIEIEDDDNGASINGQGKRKRMATEIMAMNGECEGNAKRTKLKLNDINFFSNNTSEVEETEKEVDNSYNNNNNNNTSSSLAAKERAGRAVWTPELQHKFVEAISALGNTRARPRAIHQMMGVPSLSVRQIASHLQKYRSQVQRLNEKDNDNSLIPSKSSSNIFGGIELSQTLGMDYSTAYQPGLTNSGFNIGCEATHLFPPNHHTSLGTLGTSSLSEYQPGRPTFGFQVGDRNRFPNVRISLNQQKNATPSASQTENQVLVTSTNHSKTRAGQFNSSNAPISSNGSVTTDQTLLLNEFDDLFEATEQQAAPQLDGFDGELLGPEVDQYIGYLEQVLLGDLQEN